MGFQLAFSLLSTPPWFLPSLHFSLPSFLLPFQHYFKEE